MFVWIFFEKLIFRAELFLEISKPLPVSVQMSIKIKIVWAFIDKDPETGNHLLSALHIFVMIFLSWTWEQEFLNTYIQSLSNYCNSSINSWNGSNLIFFYEWHLGWVIYYFELEKYGKNANHNVKSKYEFALNNLLI